MQRTPSIVRQWKFAFKARTLVLFGLTIASQLVVANTLSYEKAKIIADRNEGALSKASAQNLLDAQGVAVGRIIPECVPVEQPAGFLPFTVVVKIDSAGKVVNVWREGNSSEAVCFASHVAKEFLFIPPYSPFFTSFEMNIRLGK